MIVDTSAIIGVAFKEPGYEELIEKLAGADYLGSGLRNSLKQTHPP